MSDCPHSQKYGDYNLCHTCKTIIPKPETWCEKCDKERIERLDKQFNEIAKKFGIEIKGQPDDSTK